MGRFDWFDDDEFDDEGRWHDPDDDDELELRAEDDRVRCRACGNVLATVETGAWASGEGCDPDCPGEENVCHEWCGELLTEEDHAAGDGVCGECRMAAAEDLPT